MLPAARGPAILTPIDRTKIPSSGRLESAVAALWQRKDARAVVQLVERWSEIAEPTPRSRVTEARALLWLGLTDRAWVCLRDLVEPVLAGVEGIHPATRFEALLVAGQLFLERGWHAKARRPLEIALQHAPSTVASAEVRALLARVDEPPPPIPDEAPAGPEDVTSLLILAWRHLTTGSHVKARVFIERARKLEPQNARAAELTWALQGDFAATEATLAELVERAFPPIGAFAAAPEPTDEPDDRTEEADRDALDDAEDKARSFPSLFRAGDPNPVSPPPPGTEVEPTASMKLADMERVKPVVPPDELRGDTQIARVIHRDKGINVDRPTGAVHRGVDDAGEAFDLASFRREMGMNSLPTMPTSDLDGGFEEEDISRVVRISRDNAETTDVTGGLAEALEPDTTGDGFRPSIGPEAPTVSEPPPVVREALAGPPTPQPPPPHAPAPPPPSAPAAEARPIQRKSTDAPRASRKGQLSLQWWLLAVGLVLLFGTLVLFALVVITIVAQ